MITTKDVILLRSMIKDELKEVQHKCIQESPLAIIAAENARIIKDFYGNGQEGTQKMMLRISDNVNTLVGTTAGHTKVIADLLGYQSTHEGITKGKKELEAEQLVAINLKAQKRRDFYWKIATVVTIILTALGLYLKLK